MASFWEADDNDDVVDDGRDNSFELYRHPLSQAATSLATVSTTTTTPSNSTVSFTTISAGCQGFVCEHCHGREYEIVDDHGNNNGNDDDHGHGGGDGGGHEGSGSGPPRLVCSACFTEATQSYASQLLLHSQQSNHSNLSGIIHSSTLDAGEVLGLAARTKRGDMRTIKRSKFINAASQHVLSSSHYSAATSADRINRGNDHHHHQVRLMNKVSALEPLNSAQPLPDLISLVTAFQTVLHVCTDRLVSLIMHPMTTPHHHNNNNNKRNDDAKDDVDSDADDADTNAHDARQQQQQTQTIRKRRILIHKTVRALWNTYLASWSIGANHYGALYPMVRFSLRDSFLSVRQRTMIIHTLIGRNECAIRQKQQQTQQNQEQNNDHGNGLSSSTSSLLPTTLKSDGGSTNVTQSGYNNDSNNNKDDDNNNDEDDNRFDDDYSENDIDDEDFVNNEKEHDDDHDPHLNNQNNHNTYVPLPKHGKDCMIRSIVRYHTRGRPKLAHDLALITPPSMQFAACLLWLAVSESGLVPISTFCHWIDTGQLPFQNAFDTVLPPDQQESVRLCASFFQMTKTTRAGSPTPDRLREHATCVAIACRLKAEYAPQDPTDRRNRRSNDGSNVNHNKNNNTSTSMMRLGFVSTYSAPLLLAHIASDLQLGPLVLHRSLALLDKLKSSLSLSSLSSLSSYPRRTEHLLALLAIAMWMEPNWKKKWRIVRRSSSSHFPDEIDHSSSSSIKKRNGDNDDHDSDSDTYDSQHPPPLWIPCNMAQMHTLRNGRDTNDYVRYLERFHLRHRDPRAIHEKMDDHEDNDNNDHEDHDHDPHYPTAVRRFLKRLDALDWSSSSLSSATTAPAAVVVQPCLDAIRLDPRFAEDYDTHDMNTNYHHDETVGNNRIKRSIDIDNNSDSSDHNHERKCWLVEESDLPQAIMILEFLAQATRVETRNVHTAVSTVLEWLSSCSLLSNRNKSSSNNIRKQKTKQKKKPKN